MNVLERQGDGSGSVWSGVEASEGFCERKNAANGCMETRAPWAMALLQWEGIPVSPGIAQGTAVVYPPKEPYGSVPAGSILVCSSMAPSLIEFLPLCRGLVCDHGGMLNPTASTAREYGIPVVTSAGRVTKAVRDGDTIRIDGTSGTVMVL